MGSDQSFRRGSLAIVIYSRHPLVLQLIEEAIASNRDLHSKVRGIVKPMAGVLLPLPSHVRKIHIVDTHSVKQWPEALLQLQSCECKTIVLVSEKTENGSDELKGVFLGVHGIVSTSANLAEDLPKAIRAVHEGRLWISRNTLEEYVKRTNAVFTQLSFRNHQLTARERHVLEFLVRGFSDKQIGKMLTTGERAVKSHVSSIMRRLHVHSRRELLRLDEIADAMLSLKPTLNSLGSPETTFSAAGVNKIRAQHSYFSLRSAGGLDSRAEDKLANQKGLPGQL